MMTTEQQKAYESGYLAGFHNKYDCPYPKDSNEEEWWCIGYSDGVDNIRYIQG
jgi:ribosome modulation factor